MFNFLQNWNLGLQALLMIGIIVTMLVLVLAFAVFLKPKMARHSMIYIYAFSTGFLIILGTIGIINAGRENLNQALIGKTSDLLSKVILIMTMVGGALIGFSISFFVKHLVLKRSGTGHIEHHDNAHAEHLVNLNSIDDRKNKWTAIFLLTLHKVPSGLTMGLLIYSASKSSGAIDGATVLAFIVHIIPEVLIIYYRQTSLGVSKWKAAWNTVWLSLIIVPFVFVGAYGGELLAQAYWLIPLILVSAGVILIYTSVIELVPEFMHNQALSHRKWIVTVTMLMLGIMLALVILAFHHH